MKAEWFSGQGDGPGKGLKVRDILDGTIHHRERKKWGQENATHNTQFRKRKKTWVLSKEVRMVKYSTKLLWEKEEM